MVETEKRLMWLCAADIMSRNVVTIPREMSLPCAARMLARAGVTGAPVVDASGRCIGVLSATDFMNWMKSEHVAAKEFDCVCKPWEILEAATQLDGRVEDCMTKNPVLTLPNARIRELSTMMMEAHIHRVIVVDAASRPIGIVSTIDILAALARVDRLHHDEAQELHGANADETMY
jgi:CBS domain-containing protein